MVRFYDRGAEMRRRREASMRARKPWVDAAQTPFRDDALMDGPPGCTAADFELPRLRRCPLDVDALIWGPRLGEGLDGCVWKVWFGDAGPFALKLVGHLPSSRPASRGSQHQQTILLARVALLSLVLG
jgi:hypothetical protein